MRIIAGSAGGITLETAPKGIRPTMDRIRESIFSSLGDKVSDARVLDLFAGTGALGIEALSRGAQTAVFVDREERSTHCIRKNLEKCHLLGTVLTRDVFQFLDKQAQPGSFDLVFADPPYAKQSEDELAKLCSISEPLKKSLSPDGIFVLETFFKFQLPPGCGWFPLRKKRIGETQIFFLIAK